MICRSRYSAADSPISASGARPHNFLVVHGNRALPNQLQGWRTATMRKAISELDDEHRAVLLEIVDFGTAVFSSGLVVAILKSVVDLFV